MKKLNIGRIVLYIVIILIACLYLFPLLYVFNISLKTEKEFLTNTLSITKSFNFKNYITAWNRGNFGGYVINSLIYTIIGTITTIVLSIFIAFPISRGYVKGGKILFAIFMAGLFLPDGTIPLFQLMLKLKLYNTRIGYILSMIAIGGVPLYFFVTYIKSIPKDLDEAASIDGCGYFRFVFTILIPLIKPAITSMSILTAINIWNDIVRSTIFLSNQKLFPITKGLFAFSGQYHNDWTVMTAAIVIVSAPLIIIYITFQRYIVEGTVRGAIK